MQFGGFDGKRLAARRGGSVMGSEAKPLQEKRAKKTGKAPRAAGKQRMSDARILGSKQEKLVAKEGLLTAGRMASGTR